MFNIFGKKNKVNIQDNSLWINTIIPKEIAKITIDKYDKLQALATFLKMNGYNPNEIEEILKSKFPFDKAWKIYFMPRMDYQNEMLRQMNQLRLLVIEGLTNGEQRGAFILSCTEYFKLFICREVGLSYPNYSKQDYYDLKKFCDLLNNNDFETIKRRIDKDVFNCIAFYSKKFSLTYEDIMHEFIQQISSNAAFNNSAYEKIGGISLFIDMISKLLELSFNNMRFSLKTIIVIEQEKNNVSEAKDFFDFSNMKSIYEGIQTQYIIQDDNMRIAEREISKALKILDILKENNKIPSDINFDIKNIVYATQSANNKNDIQFYTFLRYTPLTKTGKIAKNMCTLNFDINEKPCECLNEGLFTIRDIYDSEMHSGLGGVIKFSNEIKITEITMFFIKNNISYHIKTKTDQIESLDDIELEINKFL